MGADLIAWDHNQIWEPVDLDKLEERLASPLGIVLEDLNELVILPDQTFSYQNRRVLVYIRDQFINRRYGKREYKFHVSNCDTIQKMFESGRSKRYVVTQKVDGKFVVKELEGDRIIFEGERKLHVCKNCLKNLNYKGYSNSRSLGLEIYDAFGITEFFDVYGGTLITDPPKDNEYSAIISSYTPDWRQVSTTYKLNVHWKCEQCGLSLRSQKQWLHTHHINHIRGDNLFSNLRAMCLDCHSSMPGHEQLKSTPEYHKFTRWKTSA